MKTFNQLKEELMNGSRGPFIRLQFPITNTTYKPFPKDDQETITKWIEQSNLPKPFRVIRFLAKPSGVVYFHGADMTHRELLKRAEPSISFDLKTLFLNNVFFPGQCDMSWNFIGDISPENIDKAGLLKKYHSAEELAAAMYGKWGWINSFVKDFLHERPWSGDLWEQFIKGYVF
jgi:hypothetical protein